MQHIPNWIIKLIKTEKLVCSKCKQIFRGDNLMSLGIQQSTQPPNEDTLCVGMFCSKCKEMTIFELQSMSLMDFALAIIEQENEEKNTKRVIKKKTKRYKKTSNDKKDYKKRSKITKKDVRKTVEFLKQTNNYEEVLIAMGMSQSDIEKYNIKKPDKDK